MNFLKTRNQLCKLNLGVCRLGLSKSTNRLTTCVNYSSNIKHEDEILVDAASFPGIAVMKFNRKPVNSLNLEFLQKSIATVKTIEENEKIGALILTSNVPNVFCAGLEFTELYGTTYDRFIKFNSALQEFWCTLFASRLATIAAINGSSPAGGCVLALACDYRIMNKEKLKYTIGLSEVKLGIILRSWISQIYSETIGNKTAHLAISLGKLFTAEEAFNVGLVDDVADNQKDLMDKAVSQAKEFINVSWVARHESKMEWRQPYLDTIIADRERSAKQTALFILSNDTQANLKAYMDNLRQRKK